MCKIMQRLIRRRFFLLNPFRIIITDHSHPVAIFRMDVMLETHTEKTKKKMERYLPVIYDAIFQDLYGMAYLVWGSGYQGSLMELKERIQAVVLSIVKEDLLRDVLVQKALFKPLSGRL